MKTLKKYWVVSIPVLLIVIILIFFMSRKEHYKDQFIGMVDADFVDLASQVPGRLDSLYVKTGDTVHKGDVVAKISSEEIDVFKNQAFSMVEALKAQLLLLQTGARPQLLDATQNILDISKDQYGLFKNTNERFQNLYNDGVVSGQERDIVNFKYEASKKEMSVARLNLEMLKEGTRPEVITATKAILKQAEEGLSLTEMIKDKTKIIAPSDGIIVSTILSEGELASMGYPVMSLQKLNTFKIKFNIRQDKIKDFHVGKKFTVEVPGVTPDEFEVVVEEVDPTLEFANWVPVKDKGKFELRTFTVVLKPENIKKLKGLRSGMTASLKI